MVVKELGPDQPFPIMAKWIKSDGALDGEPVDSAAKIRGSLGGVVAVKAGEWRKRNGHLEVLEGANVEIIESPLQELSMSFDKDLDIAACRCRKVACIGLILICCDNGDVVGGCIGVSGC